MKDYVMSCKDKCLVKATNANTIKKGQKALFADEGAKYGTNQGGLSELHQLTTDRGSSFIIKKAYTNKTGVTFVHTETIQEN